MYVLGARLTIRVDRGSDDALSLYIGIRQKLERHGYQPQLFLYLWTYFDILIPSTEIREEMDEIQP